MSRGIFSPARPQRAVGGIEQGLGQAGPPKEVFLECWEAPSSHRAAAQGSRVGHSRAWKWTPGGKRAGEQRKGSRPRAPHRAVAQGPLRPGGLGPRSEEALTHGEPLPGGAQGSRAGRRWEVDPDGQAQLPDALALSRPPAGCRAVYSPLTCPEPLWERPSARRGGFPCRLSGAVTSS